MGEERINKIKIDDLPQPEQELTPEEAQNVKGGLGGATDIRDATEETQKRGGNLREQDIKQGSDSLASKEDQRK